MMRRYKLPVWANEGTWDAMRGQLGKIDDGLAHIFNTDSAFEIGEIGVKPFPFPMRAEPVGYSFMHKGEKMSVATDIGELKKDLFAAIKKIRSVLLESNHDVNVLEMRSYPPALKRRIRRSGSPFQR